MFCVHFRRYSHRTGLYILRFTFFYSSAVDLIEFWNSMEERVWTYTNVLTECIKPNCQWCSTVRNDETVENTMGIENWIYFVFSWISLRHNWVLVLLVVIRFMWCPPKPKWLIYKNATSSLSPRTTTVWNKWHFTAKQRETSQPIS